MPSWTTPVVHATGDVLGVPDWNGAANNETFLYQAPYAMYYATASVAITLGTYTQIPLGGTTATGYGFSVVSNNLIAPLSGVYQAHFGVGLAFTVANASVSTQAVISELYHNGSLTVSGQPISPGLTLGGVISVGSGLVRCAAGDTLGLFMFNNTTITFTSGVNAYSTFMHVAFIGSQ